MSKEKRDENYDNLTIFDKCLCHRYRYYVLSSPVEKDWIYDMFEAKAKELGILDDHPLSKPGSSKEEDYPRNIISIALGMDSWYNKWYITKKDKVKKGEQPDE